MTKSKKRNSFQDEYTTKAKDKDIIQGGDDLGVTNWKRDKTANEAISLAKKFIQKAYAYKKRLQQNPTLVYIGCKESGALKRASMDLTRILVKVRNPNRQ